MSSWGSDFQQQFFISQALINAEPFVSKGNMPAAWGHGGLAPPAVRCLAAQTETRRKGSPDPGWSVGLPWSYCESQVFFDKMVHGLLLSLLGPFDNLAAHISKTHSSLLLIDRGLQLAKSSKTGVDTKSRLN